METKTLSYKAIIKEEKAIMLKPLKAIEMAIELAKAEVEKDGRFKILEPNTTHFLFECAAVNKNNGTTISVMPIGTKACVRIKENNRVNCTSKTYWLTKEMFNEESELMFFAKGNASQDE